ncbi:hypothetical protein ACLQ2R_30380 [Streptosporangium sp. DT93]|uniref:hypothetical protein n=1 Tax=Streptosporangium sp. DT93 TaxID=3393428 RepID=UPI003CF1BCFC
MTDAKSTPPTPAGVEPIGPEPVSPESAPESSGSESAGLELAGSERVESVPTEDGSTSARVGSVIPGWRLILSDAGRLWASREVPFSLVAFDAGADRTVDADTLDALRVETERQEAIAEEAQRQEEAERQSAEKARQANSEVQQDADEPQEQIVGQVNP